MSGKDRPYDLEGRTVKFAGCIIDIVERLPATRAGSHIASQLVRSGTSPASNYAEAQGAESRKDFVHKLKISLKELQETRVWLLIILEKALVKPETQTQAALGECQELIRIFAKSIGTAKSRG